MMDYFCCHIFVKCCIYRSGKNGSGALQLCNGYPLDLPELKHNLLIDAGLVHQRSATGNDTSTLLGTFDALESVIVQSATSLPSQDSVQLVSIIYTYSDAPTDPKFAEVFQNHMFLAGDPAENTNLYFSAPYAETDYSAANGAGVINVGFPIVSIKPFRDSLFIFGINNIKRLVGNNIANFVLEHVTDDLGCLASDSVVEIGGDLLFLSQDGIRPISGTNKIGDVQLESLSKNIQSLFTDVILEEDLDALSSVVVRNKSQFRLFYDVDNANGLIGGLRLGQQGGINFEFGQLLGIEVTCADSAYIGQFEFVIHGDKSGKVHRQEQGNNFGGNNIVSVYQTPFLHMQDPEQRKIIHTVATYLRSEGDNEIIMSVIYDYDDNTILNPTNFALNTEGAAAFYNEAIFNTTAIFDGNPSPVQRVNVSGSGKSVSFRYVTNDTNAAHSIQGIVVTFGVGDRL